MNLSERPAALILGRAGSTGQVYPPAVRARLTEFADIIASDLQASDLLKSPDLLEKIELFMGTWGMPVLDAETLSRMPRLRGVFYGAGSVKGFIRDAFWERNLVLSAAPAANAVPVAEFTVAAILLSLKKVWQHLADQRIHHRMKRLEGVSLPGNYRTTVGLVSLGLIGRMVVERLRAFDHRVLAYDPMTPEAEIRELGAEPASLAALFSQSDVVSLHTPWLPETEGMIGTDLLESMKPHATLLNTARGALIREDELVAVLGRRPDLSAFLDVTHPEPPPPGSPLFSLPNLFITPHIAGSVDDECGRMGELVVEEARRYVHGEALLHGITRAQLARMA
jgi:phosphoglycerate dehydrogenase-like enzyme